jgi:UDP-N-acetylglucosamine 1-carboxyvinyltransferase
MIIANLERETTSGSNGARSPEPVLRIEGGARLQGEITIGGAKNAALPLLAATLLTRDECVLNNAPDLSDIRTMMALLRALGAEVEHDTDARRIIVRTGKGGETAPPADLVKAMRASFLVSGPLLARFGSFSVQTPGGCQLGSRPVDVDVRGFRHMGASIASSDELISAVAHDGKLHGAEIYMDYPSHTGTENLLLAATLAEGRTTIVNASCEPEIRALGSMLNRMGARISGLGTPIIQVEGVDRLQGVTETILPDRLEAGTYAIASVITGGELALHQTSQQDMLPLRAKLEEMGAEIWWRGTSMLVRPAKTLRAVEVQTLPFPGFPTDLQAAMGVLMTQAEGSSKIKERVFDDRMRYTDELIAMGARIEVERLGPNRYGPEAIIHGPTRLTGAEVRALDIRAGAGVVLAGLAATGTTIVRDVFHLDRGYEGLVEKLHGVGARIQEDFVSETAA